MPKDLNRARGLPQASNKKCEVVKFIFYLEDDVDVGGIDDEMPKMWL